VFKSSQQVKVFVDSEFISSRMRYNKGEDILQHKRSYNMFHKLFLLFAALAMLTVASCAGPEPKSDFATDQLCQDLALFIPSVKKLQVEKNFTDATAIQAQFDVVRRNFNSLVASVQSLEVAEKEDFENAVDELMNTADSLPEDVAVTDALKTLQEPISDVLKAAENLQTRVECQPEPTGY
jgi:hypothetical protein